MVPVDWTVLFTPFCKGGKLSLKESKQHAKSHEILVDWNSGPLKKGISHKRHHSLIHGIIELGSPDGASGGNPEHLQVGYLFFLTANSMQRLACMHPF